MPTDPELLADYFTFTDFAHFIEVYLSVVDLIRDAEDVWTLTYEVARDLAAQNVRYAELTVTPYTSVVRGIAAEAFCEAIEDARRARPSATSASSCAGASTSPASPASRPPTSTLDVALELAAGRAGQLRPRRPRDRRAAAAVRAALRRGPRRRAAQRAARRRVDRAGDDLGRARPSSAPSGSGTASPRPRTRRCWRTCAEHGIALEVCPTSNVCTRSVPSLAEHPLPALVAAGVPVTDQLRRPADVLAPRSTTSTRSPPSCSAWTRPGVADLARAAVRAVVPATSRQGRAARRN